jgi:endoglucanase
MVHFMKLSGLVIVGAALLSGCMVDAAEDIDEGAVTEAEGLIGNPRALSNAFARTCMAVAAASQADGAAVQTAACNGSPSQAWTIQWRTGDLYEIVAQHSGKCLTIDQGSQADGARAIQWRCGGTNNQLFRVDSGSSSSTRFISKSSDKCLDLATRSTAAGIRVIQWRCDNTAKQRWIQW